MKWEKRKLGEIFNLQMGKTPSRANNKYWESSDYPWVSIADLSNSDKFINSTKEKISDEAVSKTGIKQIPRDTVIMSFKLSVGKAAITECDIYTNEAIIGFIARPHININADFLYYLVTAIDWSEGQNRAVMGVTLNKASLQDKEIPLPPLDEQRRIAAILDKADAIRRKSQQALELADSLLKSVFLDMFGDPVTNPKGWEKGTIRDIVSDVNYGTSKPATDGGKYIYLRMNNITYGGSLDLTSVKYIDATDSDLKKYSVRNGDVLFNRTNSKELVGKTCVFNKETQMIIAGYIIRVRVNSKAVPQYLSATLNSSYGKTTLFGMCKSIIGQANINAQELQNIKILIPPIELQRKFANIVGSIEAQKRKLTAHLAEADHAFKSLQQSFFG